MTTDHEIRQMINEAHTCIRCGAIDITVRPTVRVCDTCTRRDAADSLAETGRNATLSDFLTYTGGRAPFAPRKDADR